MRHFSTWRQFFVYSTVALAVSLVVGCSEKGPTRYRVHGSITYKGQPVPVGTIQFTPDASKGNSGPSASVSIKNGQYDSDIGGLGTVGGPQIVAVDAFDGKNIDPDLLPNGRPLTRGFRKSVALPTDTEAVLDIELSE